MKKERTRPRKKKKSVSQADIARAVGLDQGSVSRILNQDRRDSFAPETVERVFRVAREMGYVHSALVNTNRRGSIRKKVALEGEVTFVTQGAQTYDQGRADVHEISVHGMILKNLRTLRKAYPMEPFHVRVVIASPPLQGLALTCKPVRFWADGAEQGIAVRFLDVPEGDQQRIREYIESGES